MSTDYKAITIMLGDMEEVEYAIKVLGEVDAVVGIGITGVEDIVSLNEGMIDDKYRGTLTASLLVALQNRLTQLGTGIRDMLLVE